MLSECMAAQTYEGEIEWLVVGEDHKGYSIPETARQIKSGCRCVGGWDSLLRNLSRGLDEASFETVLFMEDDDWYHPDYVKEMLEVRPQSVLMGLKQTPVYFMRESRWMLGSSAWTSNLRLKDEALERFEDMCERKVRNPNVPLRRDENLNRWFRGNVAKDGRMLMVSLRGITQDGISAAHRELPRGTQKDVDGKILERWVGAEWAGRLRAMKNG